MKAILPHNFFLYARNFSLESMLREISFCAFSTFKGANESFGRFATRKNYSVVIGKHRIDNFCFIVQTWLIDMIYTLIKCGEYGHKEISQMEALHLIALFNDYSNEIEKKQIRHSADIFLKVYGFWGEQKRFQSLSSFFEGFAREKYILDIISKKEHPLNSHDIDVEQDIIEETGFSSNSFSALILMLFVYFSYYTHIVKIENIDIKLTNPIFSTDNFIKILDKYSITIEDIRTSPLKRQVFYTHPIIRIDNTYIASNPFLLLSLFANSNYWLMRNRYLKKQANKQKFLNAFGIYFEIYVEEILQNCIKKYNYKKIPEAKSEKRADWYLNIDGTEFLVEQKSGLSLLGIKQTQTDIEMLKKHIVKNWGEAVKQLEATEKSQKLKKPIKIILVYEDYYKSECLDELFRLDNTLVDDRKYWLVTIREFEILLTICHDNLELFKKIVKEKDDSESIQSKDGRDLTQFFEKYQINHNKYLNTFNIMKQFDLVKSLLY